MVLLQTESSSLKLDVFRVTLGLLFFLLPIFFPFFLVISRYSGKLYYIIVVRKEPLTHLFSSLFLWPCTVDSDDGIELSDMCWHLLLLLSLAMASGYKLLLLYTCMSSNSWTLLRNILNSKTYVGIPLVLASLTWGGGGALFGSLTA